MTPHEVTHRGGALLIRTLDCPMTMGMCCGLHAGANGYMSTVQTPGSAKVGGWVGGWVEMGWMGDGPVCGQCGTHVCLRPNTPPRTHITASHACHPFTCSHPPARLPVHTHAHTERAERGRLRQPPPRREPMGQPVAAAFHLPGWPGADAAAGGACVCLCVCGGWGWGLGLVEWCCCCYCCCCCCCLCVDGRMGMGITGNGGPAVLLTSHILHLLGVAYLTHSPHMRRHAHTHPQVWVTARGSSSATWRNLVEDQVRERGGVDTSPN